MTESKKAWVEPELIVLVRSKPEEAVLVFCKTADVIGGFSDTNSRCAYVPVMNCSACLTNGTS
jgi:hypothetical protein